MHSIHQTLLSIEEFARIMGLHPWFLSQIGIDTLNNPTAYNFPLRRWAERRAKCDYVTYEYFWQDHHLSREEIARAIGEAEFTFATHIGYWPAPKFITDEELDLVDAHNGHGSYQVRTSSNPMMAKLKYGYLQNIGTENLEYLSDSIAWAQIDRDGDTIPERFAYTFQGIPVDLQADEVAVFFTEPDRNWLALKEWEIRPLDITIDVSDPLNTQMIVEAWAYQFVQPDLYLEVEPDEIDVRDILAYVPTVSLYRRTVNTDDQGMLIYSRPCEPVGVDTCYGAENTRLSLVTVDLSGVDVDQSCYSDNASRYPNRSLINYLAGFPRDENGRMDHMHAQIISWLAAAYLECLPCGCACMGDDMLLQRWSEILKFTREDGNTVPIVTNQQIESLFGPKYGAVKAWNAAQALKIYGGYVL